MCNNLSKSWEYVITTVIQCMHKSYAALQFTITNNRVT